jgi:ABC-type Na+ transport system ATPase subunit NatA
LSGRDNLRSLAALRGLPGKRVHEVLEIVGLIGRECDKASTYSLGMKQRLGIAAALLPDPEMLVLGEPTNGPDPAGIVEIRDLLRSRATGGRTVVVSSHLLSEIQAMADFLVLEPPQGTSRSDEAPYAVTDGIAQLTVASARPALLSMHGRPPWRLSVSPRSAASEAAS